MYVSKGPHNHSLLTQAHPFQPLRQQYGLTQAALGDHDQQVPQLHETTTPRGHSSQLQLFVPVPRPHAMAC